MRKLNILASLGQAIWLDYIRRAFITSGELERLVSLGLRGLTSNPSIFEKAIAGSHDYDDHLRRLVESGLPVDEIYDELIVQDIGMAADTLMPVFLESGGQDGYVSLEVSPALARDTQGTVHEARRLHRILDRPNVMIKVPATPEGIQAIRTLIGEGIPVNATLLFSTGQYESVALAYITGLEDRLNVGETDLSVASVASFFVSRLDSQVDPLLIDRGKADLAGKTAIANAKSAYARFQELISEDRWIALADNGAKVQRLLWASTSTKNPEFPDTLYIDSLIGKDTVNTVPLNTLQAFLDHGLLEETLSKGIDEAQYHLAGLEELGIDLRIVSDHLLEEGLESFSRSYRSLLASIETKRQMLASGWLHLEASLGSFQGIITKAQKKASEQAMLRRIWERDYTVWADLPDEISNRLGWLDIAERMAGQIDRLDALRADLIAGGFREVVLLGMGGSSLAPEVFYKTFGGGPGGLELRVLDSTHPASISSLLQTLDLRRTVFIVATKSGGTIETLSFFKNFYNRVADAVGPKKAGKKFIAITDAGSRLDELAARYQFRDIFRNDPNIGGRYSALSYFGLVPAALVGVDLRQLLDRAMAMATGCDACVDAAENPAQRLGVTMGELANRGRDKITFFISPEIASFGAWVEQLIAESTGKSGRGILPVVFESPGDLDVYRDDRLFVHIRLAGDGSLDQAVRLLEEAGHPVLLVHLHGRYDLGGQFFLWELATVIAGQRLGIQPFDQPNVESAKVLAREMVAAYQQDGQLPEEPPDFSLNGIQVFASGNQGPSMDVLDHFLLEGMAGIGRAGLNDPYVAIQAYLPPTEENTAALQSLRTSLRDRYRLATTLGFGPRFLHSTGQLHKGDSGNGLFIQITSAMDDDLPIPDEAGAEDSGISFAVLIAAQAQGDLKALRAQGRQVIRFHLPGYEPTDIARLGTTFGITAQGG